MTDESDQDPTERSLRLVVVSEEFSGTVSGGAHVRHRFCELASEWGHDITVLTTKSEGKPRRETVNGINVIRLTPTSPESVRGGNPLALAYRILFSMAVFVYLFAYLLRNQADGVHSASTAAHGAVKIATTIFSVPMTTFLGLTQSATQVNASPISTGLERINFELFMGDVVFCRTPETKRVAERHTDAPVEILHGILHRQKIERVLKESAHGTDTETETTPRQDRTNSLNDGRTAAYTNDPASTTLAVVGRLVPIKNPVGGISIFEALPDGYELLFVGDGPERDTLETKASGIDGVHVLGQLPHEATLKLIADVDALVIPSYAESYGAVVFEALALGTHVFAPPLGVLPTIEHERLHITDYDNIPATISKTTLDDATPDKRVLEKYSMGAYTETTLHTHRQLAAQDN
jgi:glycosyltransferase involved in cell wall biosynthesis